MPGTSVTLVGRDRAAIDEINKRRTLARYLGDIELDPTLVAQTDFDGIETGRFVLMVVPAQATPGNA